MNAAPAPRQTTRFSIGTAAAATAAAVVLLCAGVAAAAIYPSSRTDRQPPSTPAPAVVAATGTSITLAWPPSTDDFGVRGYGLYLNGAAVATTTATRWTFSRLHCGTYTLGVDAFDFRGNRSARASVTAATLPCSGAPAPIPPPTTTTTTTTTTPTPVPQAPVTTTTATTTTTRTTTTAPTTTAVTTTAPTTTTVSTPTTTTTATTTTSTPPAPSTASVFVATNGNDANPCSSSAPCSTFERAYKVAQPGQVVQVAGGNYPYQRLELDSSKTSSADVVFQPAPGQTVNVDQIDFGQDQFGVTGPRHVTVRNINAGYLRTWMNASDITWDGVTAKHFDLFDSSNVTIVGSDFGPCQAPRDDSSCVPRLANVQNVTIDRTSIHGMTSTDLANYHVDGLFLRGAQNVLIERSKFYGNMITNIRLQNQPTAANANVTLENNWFGAPLQGDGVSTNFNAVDVDDPVPGLAFLYNSFAEGTGMGSGQFGTSGSPAAFVGNLMGNAGCDGSATYSHNVFLPFSQYTGQTGCGSTDRRAITYGYVSLVGIDFHLLPTSLAIAAGDPARCPATDIDGQVRPAVACDAGSDQR